MEVAGGISGGSFSTLMTLIVGPLGWPKRARSPINQLMGSKTKKESEFLCSLLFTDSNILIHSSLGNALRRGTAGCRGVGHGTFESGAVDRCLGPQVNTGGASKSVTL